mmetsp:Transcript_14744/g.36779  ORF Transcript_14744/g.36779 Transcript_14744/m.36779 type:complete len:300 (-) Transcript_14744:97-996(-)|eukprot:CAMPEP_0202877930 /NCGR_PEP_ID=MMETSP1391-20130828/31350_1 /ASSEMBLY_ACC=CAM_ASM_000867 /TAXON_ID=1034604 /ORGANISM="Chlamydomonas leiostraca, Strain SAG 11-49" /LENGTH=299 /DNA_ID=CAMNT_0049560037 /DNA_START=91 /DNA_END=990 /DNA_ORIENTATION=-
MEDTRSRWERAYVEALDFDTWGQVEEAIEGYQRLQVAAAAEYVENVLQLPMHRRDNIGKLASALKFRIQELQASSDKGVGLAGMKAIKVHMKDIIVTDASFPLAWLKPESILGVTPTEDEPEPEQEQYERDDGPLPNRTDGTLRGPPTNARRGDLLLSVFIEKWGFKDTTAFVEPRVVVSVRDKAGESVEAIQETPVAKSNTHTHVFFENTVYIQTPLNKLAHGSAIFFEFRHWKAKKQKKSCKAYCFMEMDEIKSGPVTLEIYKKPADYGRKKAPGLLSVKPLYLHLDLLVERCGGPA